MRTMTLAEYKSIAKVGDRVLIEGRDRIVLAIDEVRKWEDGRMGAHWDIFFSGPGNGTHNGKEVFATDWIQEHPLTLLSDTPDWRTGLAPIPREELRVGMRIKDGLNGTPHTITKIFDGRAHNNEGFNAFFTDSSRATVDLFLVPSPDTEWHALTESNIAKYLAVGDEIEGDDGTGRYKGKIRMLRETMIYLDQGFEFRIDKDKFRLIKKATPEVAREEPLPHVYTRDEYKVYRPDECCGKIVFFSRGPEVPAEKNTGTLFSHEAWVEEPRKIKYSKPLPNIIKPSDIIKSMSDSIQESLIATARKAKLIAIGITNPDERLAIENGIKEIDGTYTETFYQIVREKERVKKAEADEVARKAKEETDKLMYKAYADAMIADIKAVKAEEKK